MYNISIIVPVYNEEQNLEELYRRLSKVMYEINETYEIVFVNDGSTDRSIAIMEYLNKIDNRVKVIDLSRNFGHEIAMAAGIDFVTGKAVIIMDADLQNPPEKIPEMIEKWKEGYEIVLTIREKNEDVGKFKRLTSIVFYKLLNKITDVKIAENSSDFRLLDKKVVEVLRSMEERTRFLRGLIKWTGFRQTSIKFIAPKRFAGETKYSFLKLLKLSFDGISSFSSFPLKIASGFGFFISFAGFLYALYAIYVKIFTNLAMPGWTSTIITVLVLSGVQLITIGIIGEYIGRIYDESKHRPLYVVAKNIGFQSHLKDNNNFPVVKKKKLQEINESDLHELL